MSKSKVNYLKRCRKIQELTQKALNEHGNEIKYSAIWRNIIYPTYFITYATYIRMINESNLTAKIEDLERKESETTRKNRRTAPPKFEYF